MRYGDKSGLERLPKRLKKVDEDGSGSFILDESTCLKVEQAIRNANAEMKELYISACVQSERNFPSNLVLTLAIAYVVL